MKALVLAAAQSPKLEPFSSTRPKSMITIAGESILQTTLKRIKQAGINEVWIVVGHQRQWIEKAFHYGKDLDLKIDYLIQEEEAGIGKAVLLAQERLAQDEHFLLVYGDTLMGGDNLSHLMRHFLATPNQNLAMITHPAFAGSYGNIYLGHDMKIQKFIEKPEGERLANYIFGGSFILEKAIFRQLDANGGDMVNLWHQLVEQGRLAASLWEDDWIDLSRPWHILRANSMVMDAWNQSIIPASCQIDPGVYINGVVHMGEKVRIASGTTIVGPCYIGDDCYIGHSALIRDHSSIGAGSTIGYGTELKNAVLFGHSKVGRLSFIGDSVIGEGTDLGGGTLTLNHIKGQETLAARFQNGEELPTGFNKLGAFIGDNAFIGAGNILAPGTLIQAASQIPDRFTVTSNL